MTSTKPPFLVIVIVFLMLYAGTSSLRGASASGPPGSGPVSTGSSSQRTAVDVTGTWSGTFLSRQPQFSPFTITVVIGPDENGRLLGTSSVSSDCLRDGTLQVTVTGSKIMLAGGDAEGDHITFTGTIDRTGTLMNLRYVLNSSASARCESDDGTGTMGRR
jgi:hypothetical protein